MAKKVVLLRLGLLLVYIYKLIVNRTEIVLRLLPKLWATHGFESSIRPPSIKGARKRIVRLWLVKLRLRAA